MDSKIIRKVAGYTINALAVPIAWNLWAGVTEIRKDGRLLLRRKNVAKHISYDHATFHAMMVGGAIVKGRPSEISEEHNYFFELSNQFNCDL